MANAVEYTLAQKLDSLRQIAQEKLQSILCAIPDNKKELLIDDGLIKPLEHVCGATWLRTHGIGRICKFDATRTPHKKTILVYMIPGQLSVFQAVLNQIENIVAHQPQHAAPELQDLKQFHIVVLPTIAGCMPSIVEAEGLAGFVQLHRFNWDFLALDANLYSLEVPQLFGEVFVRRDTSLLVSVASSMRIMQMVFRPPAMMFTYGEHSEWVMRALLENSPPPGESSASAEFDALFVVDRDRDFASCLLQACTYSALLADVFRLRAGTLLTDAGSHRMRANELAYLQVPEQSAKESAKPVSGHLRLNGAHDAIYGDNRYRPFSEVVQLLGREAKQMGLERGQLANMQLTDMQQYVSEKLPKLQAHKKELARHLALSEIIVGELGALFEGVQNDQECALGNIQRKQTFGRIEERLAIDAHRTNALRQVCLLHLTGGGLSHDEATSFVHNYLNAFGHAALSGFVRLAEVGLFPCLEQASKITQKLNTLNILTKTPFQQECAKLKLMPGESSSSAASSATTSPDETDTKSERKTSTTTGNCPSYVFGGAYIPLVAQLASVLLNAQRYDDFATRVVHSDNLKLWRYAGARMDGAGRHPAELCADIRSGNVADLLPLKRCTIWLHVIGGLTMAECAACDLVGRVTGATLVLTSDCVAAGDDFIRAIIE